MRSWNRSVMGFMLALPASGVIAGAALVHPISVAAQTITPADLLGSWMKGPYWSIWGTIDSVVSQEIIETYGADNVIRIQRRLNGELKSEVDSGWHWTLHGDTLATFGDAKDTLPESLEAFSKCLKNKAPVCSARVARHWQDYHLATKDGSAPYSRRIVRQGDQLILASTYEGSNCTSADTLHRVDLAKLPPPPAKPPVTVDLGALAGNWARSIKKDRSDTLTLGADKTARIVDYFDPPGRFQATAGKWVLHPGNIVAVATPQANGGMGASQWNAVTVQGQLILTSSGALCSPLDVYKRVSP